MTLTVRLSAPPTGTTSALRKPPHLNHRSLPLRPNLQQHAGALTGSSIRRSRSLVVKAIEESKARESIESGEEIKQVESGSGSGSGESDAELNELGAEIKKAMEQRKEDENNNKEGDLFSGVAEEVGKIEWPAFQKVLGTTGVVIGVIAGSSVVLLTVNAVLAELSDRVFAGRGVQDFF